ncbi:MAG: GNAT family N-acetyltransferase [Nitrospira sp.]|nr:GNAT family N-acetyltransferase [Nitrospira sp.]
MTSRLSVLGPSDEAAYEAFLLGIEDSLLYYSIRYKLFLQDLLQCESQYWLAWDEKLITGVLPIMQRDGPYGRVINSLPYYGSNGGVLAIGHDAASALTAKYNELASESGVAAATWVCHPFRASAATPAHTMIDERIAQCTPLSWGDRDPESGLLSAIDGSARRNIRKAESSGVTVRIDNAQLPFIQAVHSDNMAEIGGKAKSPDFFAKVRTHFKAGTDYRIYVAEQNGTLISGLLLFYFHKTVEYFTPVTVSKNRESQPMALILTRAMVDAARQGFLRWNWGGTWLSQDGVLRFKRKWGAKDESYRYFTQLNEPDILRRGKSEILSAYPDFFVVPFHSLTSTT